MGRQLRIEYPGAVYHITSRGNERSDIFRDDSDRLKFLDMLVDYHDRYGVLIHCFVLMDNHYHLVIETPHGNLLKVMHGLNSRYTGYFNRKYNRSGHLFQGRYKAIIVDKERYLLELSRYIHLNPVRAGMVESPGDYKWSSYEGYVLESKLREWVEYSWILGLFGKSSPRRKYREYVGRDFAENPMQNLFGQVALGSDEFISGLRKMISNGRKKGILNKRILESTTEPAAIMKITEEVFGMNLKTKGDHRNAAIYLVRRYSGLTNEETGKLFGGMHYTAVSRLCKKFSEQIAADKKLNEKIKAILSRIKA